MNLRSHRNLNQQIRSSKSKVIKKLRNRKKYKTKKNRVAGQASQNGPAQPGRSAGGDQAPTTRQVQERTTSI